MRTYNIFISHSWNYSDHYQRLIEFFDAEPWFSYRNYSVPQNSPVHTTGSAQALEQAIKMHIDPSSIVIIMAGVYSSYSKWIKKEISIAEGYLFPKPILAVEPWASQRTSQVVKDSADKIVGWNGSSIVSAIKELAL